MMTDAGAALGGMWRRDAIVEVGAIDEGTRVGKQ